MKLSKQNKRLAPDPEIRPNAGLVCLAFGAIYFLWGGTFLAIRFAVEDFPPLWMMGIRCLAGGSILYAYGMFRGVPAPAVRQWRQAIVAGALFFLVAHGGLAWAQQHIASGAAALLFTTMPFWLILMDRLAGNPVRHPVRMGCGLMLGFLGVSFLIGADWYSGIHQLRLVPAGVVLLSAMSWALGSIYTREETSVSPVTRATALNLLAGGVLLLIAGVAQGEWSMLASATISWRSGVSLGYLIVFGTLLSFTAYIWLLKVSTPARVGTYSFVNPVVAVFLGWGLGEENLTREILLAAGIIVTGVILVVLSTRPHESEDTPATISAEPTGKEITADMSRGV